MSLYAKQIACHIVSFCNRSFSNQLLTRKAYLVKRLEPANADLHIEVTMELSVLKQL